MARNNKQIWRIAEWLYVECVTFFQRDKDWFPKSHYKFQGIHKDYQNEIYDLAAELLKKLSNNEFTGKDDHID